MPNPMPALIAVLLFLASAAPVLAQDAPTDDCCRDNSFYYIFVLMIIVFLVFFWLRNRAPKAPVGKDPGDAPTEQDG